MAKAQVIRLWSGKHEQGVRIPHERFDHPCKVIVVRHWPKYPRKVRVKVRQKRA